MNARNATQIQIGTWKLAKLSSCDVDSDATSANERTTSYLRLIVCEGLPAEGLARHRGRGHRAGRRVAPSAVLTMIHVEGYSPSVPPLYRVDARCPCSAAQRVSDAPDPTIAWAAASRATGTRNGEQLT